MTMKPHWRLLALLALVILIALGLGLAVVVATNLGLAIGLVVTASVLGYAGWLLFTGTQERRRRGQLFLIVGLAALIVELILFVREARNPWAFVWMIGLAGVYTGLVILLRNMYWRERRQQRELAGKTAQFRHPVLIINPLSGNGRAMKANIPKLAKELGVRVVITKKGDDIESLARQAVAEGADVLGISGGDGSIGAIAKVALDSNLPMVVLPGGTMCHLARDLGLDPNRIADALAGFTGVERRIDVGSIAGRIFLNNASFGLYANIVDQPGYREHKIEVTQKVLTALVSGEQPLYDLQFRHKNIQFKEAAQLLVGVNHYNTVNLLELGHRQKLDAGVLQITVITQLDDELIKTLLNPLELDKQQKLTDMGMLYQWETKSFNLKSTGGKIEAGVDGERESYDSPLEIKIIPKALRVFVPAEGVRNRPKSAFSWHMITQLWHLGTKGRLPAGNKHL